MFSQRYSELISVYCKKLKLIVLSILLSREKAVIFHKLATCIEHIFYSLLVVPGDYIHILKTPNLVSTGSFFPPNAAIRLKPNTLLV